MVVFFEGIVMCFILVMYCVIGIRNGAVGLVCLYEKDVQERVVELGSGYKRTNQKAVYCFIHYFIYSTVHGGSIYGIWSKWGY